MTGYNTRSMLVVPMRNRQGERIGVIQLINALDEGGNVCAFDRDMILRVIARHGVIADRSGKIIVPVVFHVLYADGPVFQQRRQICGVSQDL